MILRSLLTAAAIAAGLSGMAALVSTPAQAQDAVEAEIVGYHQLCQQGDRKACIRSGMRIGAGLAPTGGGGSTDGSGGASRGGLFRFAIQD